MDRPELYVENNLLQRRDAEVILNQFVGKMNWKPNEKILDVGCGPGDVTTEILLSFLKNDIVQLVGVDKSKQMIEYAEKTYGLTNNKISFKVLDIENADECKHYSSYFNKLFSFYCLQWTHNELDALVNMNLMLKSGGEMLVCFLIHNTLFDLYKCMDAEWQKYVDVVKHKLLMNSQEEVEAIITKAGFKIIHVESSVKKFAFTDLSALLKFYSAVDGMYYVLPPHLHDKYSIYFKEMMCKKPIVDICSTTATILYYPVIVHAIKN